MTEQQGSKGGGFTRAVAKKALGPIVASAATAATTFLMRKGSDLWEQRLRPTIENKGGGKAVASEALDGLRERLPDAATEKLDAVKSKLSREGGAGGGGEPVAETAPQTSQAQDHDREQERRKREQRRKERKRALDKAS